MRRAAAGSGHALASLGAPLWTAILVVTVIAAGFVGFGGLRPASASPAEFGEDEEARTSLYSVDDVPTALLVERIGRLSDERMRAMCAALAVAPGCD